MDAVEGNKLTTAEAVAYCLGDIIGSGIFVSPRSILKRSGSVGLSLIIWLLGAVVAAVGALVYVELGTKIRRSGCDFAYLSHAKWQPVAVSFLYVSCLLIYPSILAIQTIAFGEHIVSGLQKLRKLPDEYVDTLEHLLGFLALWVVVSMNLFSLRKVAGKLQLLVTASKLSVISLIVVVGLYHLIFKDGTQSFKHVFEGSTVDPGDWGLAMYASLYAYNGWDILNFGTEEVEKPRKTLPLAALSGIAMSAIIYLLMNVAYFSVLSKEEFLETDAIAVRFAEKTLGNFSLVVPFLIGILLLGNLNTTVFGCSRYVLAGANYGYFPSFLRGIHENSMSPRAAILIELVVAICLSFIGSLEQLLSAMTFAMWTQRSIVQIALIWMRYRSTPYPKDAFVTPIFLPVLFFFISVALVVVPVIENYRVGIIGPSLLIFGATVYFVFIYPSHKPGFFYKVDHKLAVVSQILLDTEITPVQKED